MKRIVFWTIKKTGDGQIIIVRLLTQLFVNLFLLTLNYMSQINFSSNKKQILTSLIRVIYHEIFNFIQLDNSNHLGVL